MLLLLHHGARPATAIASHFLTSAARGHTGVATDGRWAMAICETERVQARPRAGKTAKRRREKETLRRGDWARNLMMVFYGWLAGWREQRRRRHGGSRPAARRRNGEMLAAPWWAWFRGVTRSYRVKGTSRVGGGSSVKCCGDVFTSTVLIRANESTNAGKHYI